MSLNKVATHPLQTTYWRDFRESWGNEVLETKYGILTLHRVPVINKKIGMFIRGPKPTSKMLSDLKKIAREQNLIFIKMEPNVLKSDKLVTLMKKSGAVRGKTLFTPTSFWIDLAKTEDELMKSFQSKTRYNIRLSERKGVVVEEDNSKKAFDKYIELMRRTVEHQGFYAHSEKYHRMMWEHLHEEPKKPVARLLTAKYKGKIITTWIVFVWGKFLYYPYGASDPRYRNLMANNLMMWEVMRFGKKLKLKTFDLWGREEGAGFTKFKEGYDPDVVEFLGTWDLVINKPMYYLYRAMESVRWIILRGKSRFVKPSF